MSLYRERTHVPTQASPPNGRKAKSEGIAGYDRNLVKPSYNWIVGPACSLPHTNDSVFWYRMYVFLRLLDLSTQALMTIQICR